MADTQTGTPYYTSPEIWREESYGIKADIWSLGCIIYEMITLETPFKADNMPKLYEIVNKGAYPKVKDEVFQELGKVVECLLQIRPEYRPSCGM